MRRLLIVTLALALSFALLAGILRAGAADDDGLRSFLLPPDECAAPCWQGIRPGVTSADEAEALLIANPWVTAVNRTSTHISWHWSGAQPVYIDADAQGILYLGNERVSTMSVSLNVSYGEVWSLLGAPDSAVMVRPASRSTAYQIVDYSAQGVAIVSSLSCPMRPAAFWTSATALRLGANTFSEAMNGVPYDIFEQPGWWRWLATCRRQFAN